MPDETETQVKARPAEAAKKGGGLKIERDRFVALAFCWADLLLELDEEFKIIFAGGATSALVGRKTEELIGTPFIDLIADLDKRLMQDLLVVAEKHGRIENPSIRLAGKSGTTAPLSLAGYRLDDLGGHYFLALRTAVIQARSKSGAVLGREEQSGLYDSSSFSEIASDRLQAANEAGQDAEMSLISLSDFKGLSERLDEEGQEALMSTVGATLRANSVDGDAAARIGDDKFGLVHDAALDLAALENQIGEITREFDPEGRGASAQSATIKIGVDTIDDEDLANGLVYAINKFRDAKGDDFNIKDFSSNLNAMVDEAMKSVSSFKKIVDEGKFEVAFHPIIGVDSGVIHHYEALVRFNMEDMDESPYEKIIFAEETGLIWNFDIAMATKVIDWLKRQPEEAGYSVAINISGRSMENIAYLGALHTLLKANKWARGKLLFEVTESSRIGDLTAANRFIQSLRDQGYEVCLDDFGAGAASFQYLSTLEIDVVKLDGSAVHNAMKARKGKAFLTALTRLCRDLDIQTIAEMIDDDNGLKFVRECNVDFVQGFLFGKPSTEIEKFEPSLDLSLFPGARGQTADT